ncbi:major facilitator superfamily domain-containing protein [Gongronella butleri]|nr:major facilitator superfamily domain-containing protein [Gongronella butleri]
MTLISLKKKNTSGDQQQSPSERDSSSSPSVTPSTASLPSAAPPPGSRWLPEWVNSPLAGSLAACLILWSSFGVRQCIGLFLIPVTTSTGWDRTAYSVASALLQLMWGVGQPFIVYLAEQTNSHGKVVFVSCLCYASTSFMMYGTPWSNPGLFIFANAFQGLAAGGNSFPIALSSVGRRYVLGSKSRNVAFGIVSAFGSMGQFCFLPLGRALIASIGWKNTFLVFGVIMLATAPFSVFVQTVPAQATSAAPDNKEKMEPVGMAAEDDTKASGSEKPADEELASATGKLESTDIEDVLPKKMHPSNPSIGYVLKRAFTSPTFILITLGFTVCGFHIGFLSSHIPAYLEDDGINPTLAAWVVSIFGIGSVIGTVITGIACSYMQPKYILTIIYSGRALLIAIFYFLPLSMATIFSFAAVFGLFWLSTVPPTMAFVGKVFGNKYIGTLSSITFVGHQIGSFCGAFLGGVVYDARHNYTPMWIASLALAFFAAAANVVAQTNPVISD